MKITVYHKNYEYGGRGINDFLDVFLMSRMKYLASDLVYEGVPKDDIVHAVKEAMAVLDRSGIKVKEHFRPVYTQLKGTLFKDFRMTQKGWFVVLLNLPPRSDFGRRMQLHISNFLEGRIDL
ncbi:hypothetical protein [Flagellimonas sp. SN16]|uniref:hypothetical protein n=1 Tax=Flagellimonas sp. SN16 TaxID=3415142 RepID=UPI000C8B6E70|nr:hypothetical protein [Pseudozobellia sp.]|tara:strand:+ start:5260 stop:5625 length:366 start_codon:yes stop_codon:yes gene_type:complete